MVVFSSLDDPKLVPMILRGSVGVLPTDTVYGLCCSAADKQSVERLYATKRRQQKPGTVIAASVDQLVELGLKARYLKPIQHYWPNPISVVIPNYELAYLHLGVGSIAVRVPNDTALCALLQQTGPLLSTSANHPDEPEAINLAQAQQYFSDTVDFYVDGGDYSRKRPSTVIRVVDDAVEVLRQGAININEAGEIESL